MSPRHLEETSAFEIEPLPGWWDDWVIAERERLRIMQLAEPVNISETPSRVVY
jgi:hypothetical protein